jgi:gamma-glutamyltranspeptidase/glutathione hydrolase
MDPTRKMPNVFDIDGTPAPSTPQAGRGAPTFGGRVTALVVGAMLFVASGASASEEGVLGVVSAATPEAVAAGVEVLERGGNAVDAAIAVSLALGVSEPAGSGLAGQTVMLVRAPDGRIEVVHGTTWSPAVLPDEVTDAQLRYGHTAASVPSTPKVLDLALRRYGSGALTWSELVHPAVRLAREGVRIGPFRARAFRFYGRDLARQEAASALYLKPDGRPWAEGELFRQPVLARTLERLAEAGAEDFYRGAIAAEIVRDMEANGGWITAADLAEFPEPAIVAPLVGDYRGHEVATLPPPFGGWVLLQALELLEQLPATALDADDDLRRLQLLRVLRIAHRSRRDTPVPGFTDWDEDVARKISAVEAGRLLRETGETTHFSVVDAEGRVVAVTQSIDSYFGARVAHPGLGFLYNNYMQGFRLEDDGGPYVLRGREMVLSSMSGAIVSRGGEPLLVLGSPGSARIISAVAQVASYWIDVEEDVEGAVSAFRVHGDPDDQAWIEGPRLSSGFLAALSEQGFSLYRPSYSVSDSHLDPYFGGVHAIARESGAWVGAADPRRDGTTGIARRRGAGPRP